MNLNFSFKTVPFIVAARSAMNCVTKRLSYTLRLYVACQGLGS